MERDHTFGQDRVRPGEARTLWVIAITAAMMVVELIAGWLFGSMALLADGLHMASHAGALSITAFAYVYARRHAANRDFSFGTGKVNALAGFAGAVLLALFAILMAGESVHRLLNPVTIAFNQAIIVAVAGLLVNGASVFILNVKDPHDHDHGHGASHNHAHDDHNLRSAYLHVLADALTSVLAIVALVAGKFMGWQFLDPVVGILGAVLVARWSIGLLRDTSRILLDRQAPPEVLRRVTESVEGAGDAHVTDLHIWSIGPGIYAAEIEVRTPTCTTAELRSRVPGDLGIVHLFVETRE